MMLLILTGMAIHYPDRFALLGSMANAIRWHSWVGFALMVNAFLGVFYHFTAEKYHHFLPRMDDFTGAAVQQARFYLYESLWHLQGGEAVFVYRVEPQ